MKEQFSRTAMLLGDEAIEKLASARVAVFGVGGVGGYAVEALARAGVGTLDLVDNDTVCQSNINRQIIATHSTLGRYKTEVARERVLDINPDAVVNVHNTFFLPENAGEFDFSSYNYVIDAIDTVKGKLGLIECCKAAGVPIISSMGAGNKLDPTKFEVADIYKTSVCPLARVMRYELRRRKINELKVVYSKEEPISPPKVEGDNSRKVAPGSVSFVPSVAGLIIAGEVIKDLIKEVKK